MFVVIARHYNELIQIQTKTPIIVKNFTHASVIFRIIPIFMRKLLQWSTGLNPKDLHLQNSTQDIRGIFNLRGEFIENRTRLIMNSSMSSWKQKWNSQMNLYISNKRSKWPNPNHSYLFLPKDWRWTQVLVGQTEIGISLTM